MFQKGNYLELYKHTGEESSVVIELCGYRTIDNLLKSPRGSCRAVIAKQRSCAVPARKDR